MFTSSPTPGWIFPRIFSQNMKMDPLPHTIFTKQILYSDLSTSVATSQTGWQTVCIFSKSLFESLVCIEETIRDTTNSVFTPRAYVYHSFVYSLHKQHKCHISCFSFYFDIFKLSCSSPFSINTDTKNWDQHLRQH